MEVQITNRQSVIQIVRAASSDIISTLGGDTFGFALGLMLLHTTHSALSFGLGSIIYPIIGLLLMMPVGNLIDWGHHKPLILTSKALNIGALIVYAVLADRVANQMLLAILVLMVTACCDKVTNTGFTASIHELVNDNHIKTLATIEQAATAGIQLISPVLAAALYGMIGFDGIVRVEIVAESIVWLITLSMRFHPLKAAKPEASNSEAASNQPDQAQTADAEETAQPTQTQLFKIGLQYIWHRFTLRSVVVIGVFLNFLFSSVDVGLPYAIVQARQMSNTSLSIVMSGFAAGILIGNLVLSMLPTFKRVLLTILRLSMVVGGAIFALGLLFMSSLPDHQLVLILVIWALLVGLTLAFVNTPMSVYIQMTVPTELLGRVGSTFGTLMQLAVPLGTAVYSLFFQHVGAGPVYAMTGLIVLVYIGFNLLRVQQKLATGKQIDD
ncbi:MFS transporter [Levilactobacillus enshiensis]|uniref:MFS transporter n=1 Tax=Levilactobacillus enshiensis TaxID=2590213 RepID=UPI001179F6B5|nr:MFS transporter [Levilactobacillus enshiensis]